MNNKEFINELSLKTGYSVEETQKMVHTILDSMTSEFEDGNGVSIVDFGSFEIRKKMERVVVNPSSQQRMLVPPKLVLAFRPANSLKDQLKKKED